MRERETGEVCVLKRVETLFMMLYSMQLSKLLCSTILVLDTYTEELKAELKQTDIA